MTNRDRTEFVYKILSETEWAAAVACGEFGGSTVDIEHGYIHFSASDQVAETAAKHFKGRDGLLLVAVDVTKLVATLRWEPSRGGALFPHLYGPLPVAAVAWVTPLAQGAGGIPVLPAGFGRC